MPNSRTASRILFELILENAETNHPNSATPHEWRRRHIESAAREAATDVIRLTCGHPGTPLLFKERLMHLAPSMLLAAYTNESKIMNDAINSLPKGPDDVS